MSKKFSGRRLREEELEVIAQHFRLLGEPMRLKILQTVCREPCTVGDIVTAVGATQANVSKHLSLLAAAGIVSRRKDGQCVYYALADELTLKMCALVREQLAD
jgi:DNA-binding transcriptional ArsR family regulator